MQRNEVVQVPTIAFAVVLSLLVHVAALWLVVPRLRETADATDNNARLAVRLVPRDRAVAATAPPAAPATKAGPPPVEATTAPESAPARKTPPVRTPKHAPSASAPKLAAPPKNATRSAAAPVLAPDAPAPPALPQPAPSAPAQGPQAMAAAPDARAPPTPAPPTEDLAAYIEAQRRARGEAPAANESAESDIERRNRIVASNLGLDRTPAFGDDPRNAGGLFQIVELGYDDARFYFFGFDREIRRNARQLIEVRRGDNPDIRIAVVRKMIGIIREKSSGDFVWVSHRLGRGVTLSARPEDNAGLEEFILRDVFP